MIITKKTRCAIIVLLIFGMITMVNAGEVDRDHIKSVQSTLNYWGYDCGTPDGVAGAKTAAAVRQYQHDQGIKETGEITATLVNRMIAGVPWNVFEKRYNQAVDYWNSHTDMTSAPAVGYLHYDVNTEDFSPNDNLTLSINPNYADKRTIGLINLGKSNGFDSPTAMVEGFCTFYAFDQWMETPLDATDTFDGLLKDEGSRLSIDGIEYTNYSTTGMMLIKGIYDNFEGSPVTSDIPSEESAAVSSDGTRHITDFDTFYAQCVEDNKKIAPFTVVHEKTKTKAGKKCFQIGTTNGEYLVVDFTEDDIFAVGIYPHDLKNDDDVLVGLIYTTTICLRSLDGTELKVASETIKKLFTSTYVTSESGYGALYGTSSDDTPYIALMAVSGAE